MDKPEHYGKIPSGLRLWAGLLCMALVLASACRREAGTESILGKWDVAGVEYQGKFIRLGDKVALSQVPGTQTLSRQGFELTQNGNYRSGSSMARWKALDKGSFQIEYAMHSGPVQLKIEYRKKGKQLLIHRPGGNLWIVMEPAS